ncbi:TetR/AcrR family transcriptional regulator [Bacillus massiliigorillae]|uniref:TetR/AcrR family transcriptional regulator n=1 Tax=Bacillus massiliigorillae TaxID=1243664 RepID=UPI0003A1EACB|nr:TetR/AcrR family transcriptional regulator [Bacillus massiliigorillae]
MVRNKNPEKTIEQILSISYRLFLEKGYEQTTIQDIINELGMSKGAIYHHFKSKEEILHAIGDKGFNERNTFQKYKNVEDLNGLEKIKKIICEEFKANEKQLFDKMSISLADNPKFVSTLLHGTMKYGVPLFQDLIEEGKKDGSITVEDSKSASEVILLLNNIWLSPMIIKENEEELERKIMFLKNLTDQMGVPFMDEEVLQAMHSYLKTVFKK